MPAVLKNDLRDSMAGIVLWRAGRFLRCYEEL
jgi:hypothetical protein